MVDVLKKSGVRDAADGVNVGSDFYDALDDEVKETCRKSRRKSRR